MARASPHAESSCSPDRKASLLVLGALLSIIGCAPPGEGESALSPGDHAPNHEVDSAPQLIDESPLVALTPTELNNTYRDLLGFPSSPEAWPDPPEIAKAFSASENEVLGVFGNAAIRPKVWPWVFPNEAGQQGFEGLAGGQEPSAYGVEMVSKAATHFAAYALVSERFVACDEPMVELQPETEGPTWDDARPILNAACGACHGGTSSGDTDFAVLYGDNLQPSGFCAGETVGACAVSRILDGSMPPNGKPHGISGEQLAVLETWVSAGMPDAPPRPGTWESVPEAASVSCGLQSVLAFAERAWRGPLDAEEIESLEALWAMHVAAGSVEEAILLTVAAVLQSPRFLFRIEHGDPSRAVGAAVPLTDFEMASRLSYFLWDSLPDDALLEAAEAGALRTADQIEAHARRLLKDDRARSMVVHFHDQLLELPAVLGISPARRVFGPAFGLEPAPPLDTTGDETWPSVLGPIRRSLLSEARLFVERTIFDGAGTLVDLLTDNHGYVSAATEPLYGPGLTILPGPTVTVNHGYISASGGVEAKLTLYPAEFPPNERAGLLTLPSVLSVGAYAVHPAPILRGKRILERLFCQELGAPPPNAEAAAPPDSELADATNRERTEIATSPPECAGCHAILNPPGFAFEAYDAMGRHRSTDNSLPVDTTGNFSVFGGESFSFEDGVDLSHQLSQSERIRDCYTVRWASYATGTHLEIDDPALGSVQEAFRAKDKVRELLVHIARSDFFRFRPAEVSP